jgi:hypothetical protein
LFVVCCLQQRNALVNAPDMVIASKVVALADRAMLVMIVLLV